MFQLLDTSHCPFFGPLADAFGAWHPHLVSWRQYSALLIAELGTQVSPGTQYSAVCIPQNNPCGGFTRAVGWNFVYLKLSGKVILGTFT